MAVPVWLAGWPELWGQVKELTTDHEGTREVERLPLKLDGDHRGRRNRVVALLLPATRPATQLHKFKRIVLLPLFTTLAVLALHDACRHMCLHPLFTAFVLAPILYSTCGACVS